MTRYYVLFGPEGILRHATVTSGSWTEPSVTRAGGIGTVFANVWAVYVLADTPEQADEKAKEMMKHG